MITAEFKQKVLEAIADRKPNYASDAKMSVALGISAAQFSRIQKGELDKVLADAQWISIARFLDVNFGNRVHWVTAETETFKAVSYQLRACQDKSISLLLCDQAGIGKTYTARDYVKKSPNAVYIDCSQVKSKQQLVRQIAKEFGVAHTKRYADVYNDLVFYLKTLLNPLVILDEAGDLAYPAFLELKALWNATEYVCGWYMMGADGLKAKIESQLRCQKVGYAEMFRRYGEKFQRITPQGKEERTSFMKHEMSLVAKANGLGDIQKLFAKTEGSLTRVYIEAQKQSNTSAA
jgi:hypothetical protein